MKRLMTVGVGLLAGLCFMQRLEASTGTLAQLDFNGPGRSAVTPTESIGTIDVAGSAQRSGGWLLASDLAAAERSFSVRTGPIPCVNTEKQLGKLTMAFDLSASSPRPVRIRVESFDQAGRRTGGLQSVIYPAAADFYQRYAIDLSSMKPDGAGLFDPSDPQVGFSFQIDAADGWTSGNRHEVRIDNLHYARPAFYVSPKGDDSHDGLTEATAFASPQRAVIAAQPGDIVLLMEGVYGGSADRASQPVVEFVRPGTPAGWITLKNYPGQVPTLSSSGQIAVSIKRAAPPSDAPLAYLEVRGIHVRGNGDTAREQFPDEIGQATPHTDTAGIFVFGRGRLLHHVRLADNTVEFCTGDGIYIDSADWLSVENNIVRNNCWTTVGYAPAGLAVMKYANFDAVDNCHKFLIAGNRVSGNRLFVKNHPWGKPVKTGYFNGNGILIDANAEAPPAVYAGRTLVQNNLVFDNGAGGIQMWGNHRVDLVNNTVYQNGTLLKWGQFGFERCRDVRLINNVIVARADAPLDTWSPKQADKATADIVRTSNLYFGGVRPNVPGTKDLVADPAFINVAADAATADFRPRPDSPAVRAGTWDTCVPAADIDGRPRSADQAPTLGAFQP